MATDLENKLNNFLETDTKDTVNNSKKVLKKKRVVQEIIDHSEKVIIVENKQLLFS